MKTTEIINLRFYHSNTTTASIYIDFPVETMTIKNVSIYNNDLSNSDTMLNLYGSFNSKPILAFSKETSRNMESDISFNMFNKNLNSTFNFVIQTITGNAINNPSTCDLYISLVVEFESAKK